MQTSDHGDASTTAPRAARVASSPEAAASTEASDALPDEDVLVLSAAMRRELIPRRGGTPGSVLKVDASTFAMADQVLAEMRPKVGSWLTPERYEPDVLAEAQAYLADGLTGATPRGVALVMNAVHAASRVIDDRHHVFADTWVAARGVVFATRVVMEMGGILTGRYQNRQASRLDAPLVWRGWFVLARRVRAHLAQASDHDYEQVGAVLAEYRSQVPQMRRAASFLQPTCTDWVDEDCADLPAGRLHFDDQDELLWCAGSSTTHLRMASGCHHGVWQFHRWDLLVTAADGAREALVPLLMEWFDHKFYLTTEGRQRFLAIVARIPSDVAFQAILDRLDQPHVQPAAMDAMKRFPVRAVRLLAEAAGHDTANGRIAAGLLRDHVMTNPAAVKAALPMLDSSSRERVTAILDEVPAVPEAPVDSLPPVLVSPPWTMPKPQTDPPVVVGLVRPDDVAVVWEPGEREKWRNARPRHRFEVPSEWPREDVARLRRDNTDTTRFAVTLFSDGPEELARPLLLDWRPGSHWLESAWLRRIVGRWELEALPALRHLAWRDPTVAGEMLLPYADPEVADLMAEWLLRLKSMRSVALAWLTRHVTTAARALMPAALGDPGPARRAAENALHAIVRAGHREAVAEAARWYGDAAFKAAKAVFTPDPLDALPEQVPTLPDWLDPAMLHPVLLRDRAHRLSKESVRHVCTMLAMSTLDDVYAGVDVVKQVCDPASLVDFTWMLFCRWKAAGHPASETWILHAVGLLGNDETAERLAPLIRAWPGEGGHKRAVLGLDVLAAIGTDTALTHLYDISQKVKFKALKARAAEKVTEVAENLGLTAEELGDRLIPDFGLDANGSMVLDYGSRQFTVGFDENLKPYVVNADGKPKKALPKPGACDDQERASAEYKRFATLKREVRKVAADQIQRLERAMVDQRRWSTADFRRFILGHPLLWHVVRRLVWATFSGDTVKTAFRVAEDRTFADVNDDVIELDDDAVVGIPHPLHLGDAVPVWADLFADYEIVQPFPQLAREVYRFTEEERNQRVLKRFEGATVPPTALLGMERFGWRRGAPQDNGDQRWLERDVPGRRAIVVVISPGIVVGHVAESGDQTIAEVWLNDEPVGGWIPRGNLTMGELDPVTASEILRDLTKLTS